jgi:hypothetical protein
MNLSGLLVHSQLFSFQPRENILGGDCGAFHTFADFRAVFLQFDFA